MRENMKKEFIIIAEDNEAMRFGMTEGLRRDGYEVESFENGQSALNRFRQKPADLIITDLRMDGMDGISLLAEVKKLNELCEVMLISAYGTVDDAVKAMRLGAADFITKPFSTEELRIRVNKITNNIKEKIRLKQLEAHNEYLRDEITTEYGGIIGKSEIMKDVFRLVDQVAVENSAILIEGESGTGKELVARSIHEKSLRKNAPFIRVNCGALNDNLLESELFGHEKGSFTGAIRQKKGRFELADGGTLFLDEIGEVSQAMQVKLLRVLQEKEFERVGGDHTLSVDVRIIAATNKNLKEMIANHLFREDLYYRLSVIPFHLPALRERSEDIPLLTEHFISRLNAKRGIKRTVSKNALSVLCEYPWPGNIRELENLIERLHIISNNLLIDADIVASQIQSTEKPSFRTHANNLDSALEQYEKEMIVNALEKAKGVKTRAAKYLGLNTSTLYYKMEKFNLLEKTE
ncbi:MAG: sigma-54-dependent Fis family transcriptional regulator [Calditrichaceae bacterium]|nr:sigma-54-dependent Fis family transcriptional regulator [Calditrichaceae bacterium]MBN2708422.1 sigma-54-dependent Fis family transcriptional regulator [Calditrichaceae bacterium]RQV93142.1 MAG: sigma-54-dependent Fis family transcriptional regulator [Calditrichota bacterium]